MTTVHAGHSIWAVWTNVCFYKIGFYTVQLEEQLFQLDTIIYKEFCDMICRSIFISN